MAENTTKRNLVEAAEWAQLRISELQTEEGKVHRTILQLQTELQQLQTELTGLSDVRSAMEALRAELAAEADKLPDQLPDTPR